MNGRAYIILKCCNVWPKRRRELHFLRQRLEQQVRVESKRMPVEDVLT